MERKWIDVNDNLPNGPGDIVNVMLSTGDTKTAYYHRDCMAWLSYYTKERLSHFQCYKTHKFLHDVTHWMKQAQKE